jgi:hypothetical protein
MVIIRFPDEDSKQRALGRLPGHCPGKSWASGEMMMPEEALVSWRARESVSWLKGRLPMSRLRRYEILLPRKFNDGQPVPDQLISDTLRELETRFGAISWETQVIRGSWQHQGDITKSFACLLMSKTALSTVGSSRITSNS